MASKKIIAVVGATGQQGGALIRAILKDGEYAARGLARDPNSKKAEELKKLGAEVVQANVTDADSLTKAIEGCYGMFCVTYIDHDFNPDLEMAQGIAMSKAAKNAGIKHVVFSTLEETLSVCPLSDNRMPTLNGKYKIPHYDVKAEIDQLFIKEGIPTSFLLTVPFMDNFIAMGMGPRKGPDGNLILALPVPADGQLLWIAVDDIGKCAFGMFKKPSEYIGKRVGIYGDKLTLAEVAEKIGKAVNKPIIPHHVDFDSFRKLGFPGAVELGNMFQYYYDFKDVWMSHRDIEESRKLNPELMSLDQWLQKYGNQIKLPE